MLVLYDRDIIIIIIIIITIIIIVNVLMPVNRIVLHIQEPYWYCMTAALCTYQKKNHILIPLLFQFT